MAEVEKIIEDLRFMRDCMDEDGFSGNAAVADRAIQTIRELQEQNDIFQRTINALMRQIQEIDKQINNKYCPSSCPMIECNATSDEECARWKQYLFEQINQQ